MSVSRTGTIAQVRQSFADQFEQDGNFYIYRQSQKGEAFRVSTEEHDRFLGEFERNYRRGIWAMYGGLSAALGMVIGWSLYRGVDLSQGAIFAAMAVVFIPFLFYSKWIWGAPARELAGRTPIAGPRSSDEVRRRQFQKISYGGLAIAAIGGAMLPFLMSARGDLLSGWNRLWAVAGGALVLIAAIQAFRKWRVEQEGPFGHAVALPSGGLGEQNADAAGSETQRSYKRYLIAALVTGAAGLLLLTSVGKRLVAAPAFFPVLMIGCGCYALFTVVQGFRRGRIEPFIRGFSNTYERETEPKRFWASMAWNSIFACFCLWIAFPITRDALAQSVQDRCYNQHREFSASESSKACTDLIEGRARLTYLTKADAYDYRGIADANLRDRERAVADYTQAIHLWPQDENAYLNRGLIFLDSRRFDEAVSDLSRAHALDAASPWPIASRGIAYASMKDTDRANSDFDAVAKVDPTNPVMLRGRAIISINELNMRDAVNNLTASLKRDPDNRWAVRTRAWAFRQLGDDEHADEDMRRFEQLSAKRPS